MSADSTDYREWFAKAESDLLCVRNEVAAEETPWGLVCYHAQQAAEKYLKGFLVHHGRPYKLTHDLEVLLTLCAEVDAALLRLEDECERLTASAAFSRYPCEIFEADEAEGLEMREIALRVKKAVLDSLGEAST